LLFEITYSNENVQETLSSWPKDLRAAYERITGLIVKYGPMALGAPYIKALGDGLFEIRSKSGRAFFCMAVGKKIVILHAFIKKTNRTPKNELALARKKKKEYEDKQANS
jgi:phage-related protein